MSDREPGKPIDVTPRLITPSEASDLTVPVDELPVEPKEWAEAWHAIVKADRKAGPREQSRIGKGSTLRLEQRARNDKK